MRIVLEERMEIIKIEKDLFRDIDELIKNARADFSKVVNDRITTLYWNIGKRINQDILMDSNAEYGKNIIEDLSKNLTMQYGSGWSSQQLWQCIHFAKTFTEEKLYAVRRELTWTNIRMLMYIEDSLKRDFYIEMCRLGHWSSRTLKERMNSMLYERTAISKKPDETIKQELALLEKEDKLTQDLVFRDPYILKNLGLKDTYSEKDLESAILRELEDFIVEFGSDFAFMARQKRITIDNEDYYIDLLFYHRRLKCLVAIDLKLGKFEAGFKGQMELYLRWLEKYEKVDGENSPIGLILCSEKNEEHVELLQLEDSNIRVAEYYTKLPDMKLLEQKLKESIAKAKAKFD